MLTLACMSLFSADPPLFPESPPLRQEWVHAHCDGGSRGNPGPSGFGAVITDAKGQTLAELSDFLGVRTNNYAEYSGLLAVLQWVLENDYTRVKVVSDSELMVKQVQGKYKVNSPDLKPLWQQARDRIAQLESFEIAHALRHKNKEADALANQAMDRGTARVLERPARHVIDKPADEVEGIFELPLRTLPPGTVRPPPAIRPAEPRDPVSRPLAPTMLRGFTKDGTIHLLGGGTLPDGIFVKIIRE